MTQPAPNLSATSAESNDVPTAAVPPPLLSVDHLTVRFASAATTVTAARSVSLTVRRGEVAGLVGESGCGKSVCALSILRLLPPPPICTVSGRILFEGVDISELGDHELRKIRGRRISMIFQEPLSALNPVFTVGEQVAEIFRIHHKSSRRQSRDRAIQMLARVGLADPQHRARQYPHELSGGMRQRVLIAMALACEPALLIADEPTTALDVTVQAQILDRLMKLKKEFGLSVLFITHDLAVVSQICQTVFVLYAGRVVENGPVETVFKTPFHPYTAGLMDCLPENATRGDSSGRVRPKELKGALPSLGSLPAGCVFAPRCPEADNKCRQQEPDLQPVSGQPDRQIRCHHPLEES